MSTVKWNRVAVHTTWIVLTAIAIVILKRGEPNFEEKLGPVPVRGVVGERMTGRNFAVKAGSIKAAHIYLISSSIIDGAPPAQLNTSGIWLSVAMETEALTEQGYISAQLRDRDGRIFPAEQNYRLRMPDVNLDDRLHSVGLPETGTYFFEVPPQHLAGLHLQVFWGALTPSMMDSLVDIDLDIDAARARQLLADAESVVDLRP